MKISITFFILFQFLFLREIVQSQILLKTDNNNSILKTDYHLLQFFGDLSLRSTNFYESQYQGGVITGEARLIFPRFNEILNLSFSVPEPYFSATLKNLKDLGDENRIDYGVGIEWRILNKVSLLDNPFDSWMKDIRIYSIFLNTKFLHYQDSYSWRPKTDFRFGFELYKETNLFNEKFYWSEVWSDASWRKTNFFNPNYDSWTFAFVPKIGVKIFIKKQSLIMPYITGEVAVTQRIIDFWQNRILLGGGIRLMHYNKNESNDYVFIKRLKFYLEFLKVLKYFEDDPSRPKQYFDLRIGINYSINWS